MTLSWYTYPVSPYIFTHNWYLLMFLHWNNYFRGGCFAFCLISYWIFFPGSPEIKFASSLKFACFTKKYLKVDFFQSFFHWSFQYVDWSLISAVFPQIIVSYVTFVSLFCLVSLEFAVTLLFLLDPCSFPITLSLIGFPYRFISLLFSGFDLPALCGVSY